MRPGRGIRPEQVWIYERGSLAADPHRDAVSLRGTPQDGIHPSTFCVTARHGGDDEGKAEPVAEELDRSVDLFEVDFRRCAMNELHVLEPGAPVGADVSCGRHAQVICLPGLDLVGHRSSRIGRVGAAFVLNVGTLLYTHKLGDRERGLSEHRIRFVLNGDQVDVTVPASRSLLSLLRDDLSLTGTKEGCSVGVCGACSVLVDGEVLSSCILPAVFIDGTAIRTVEGLASGSELSDLQEAFIRHGGFQCGICTPGQLIAASALLDEVKSPTVDEVRRWMMGNLCRCTGYDGILKSILVVSQSRSSVDSGTARE